MMKTVTAALAVVGATFAILVGAVIGAAIAFAVSTASLKTRLGSALGGVALGVVGAPAVGSGLKSDESTWAFLALLLALFSMALVAEGFALIKDKSFHDAIIARIRPARSTPTNKGD